MLIIIGNVGIIFIYIWNITLAINILASIESHGFTHVSIYLTIIFGCVFQTIASLDAWGRLLEDADKKKKNSQK